jgi:hypothetical protein
MLCRGYNADAQVYVGKKRLGVPDILVLALALGFIIAAQFGLKFL